MQARGFEYRFWNRDLAACLDMMIILRSLRVTGEMSERFRRDQAARPRRTRFEEPVHQRQVRPCLE
jgi:hypothetical protein